MKKIKILVVEDELIIAEGICETLEAFGYEVFEPAATYDKALKIIENDLPDLAILDIRLNGEKTGIDLGRVIKERYNFPFIFLTSNSDSATFGEVVTVEPSAFLAKPYVKDELYAAIELAILNFSKQEIDTSKAVDPFYKESIFVKKKDFFVRVQFEEIKFVKSDNVYLDVHLTSNKVLSVRGTMDDFISRLDERFLRCHRSYIINLDLLKSFNHNTLILENEEIPIGSKYAHEIATRFNII